jgi:hypothetical protein
VVGRTGGSTGAAGAEAVPRVGTPVPGALPVGVAGTVGVAGPLLTVSVTVEPDATLAPLLGLARAT